RPDQPGQGALHRLLELRRLSADGLAVAEPDAKSGGFRHVAGRIQPGGARLGARARAAVPGKGPGYPALVAASGRFLERQIRPLTTAAARQQAREIEGT